MANLVTRIFRIILIFVDFVVGIVLRYVFEKQREKLPPIVNPILLKSATQLAVMIRKREVRCRDVMSAFIDRIKTVNPKLNAVVANRFSEALSEASKVDDMLDSDELPDEYSEDNAPLLGIPFTAKEAFGIVGLPNTSGLLCRKNVIAERDADVVANLRRAGAIPIGLTNCSELCMWYESFNLVYGRTNNAYHLGRMVGGSSGGEGCILSAAGSVIGVGSDVGGSIRMPAFFNGIFGHKPTTGTVSNEGQFPCAEGEERAFLSTGPMCRYTCDLIPMFKIMAGPQGLSKLKLDKSVDVRKLTFYYMEDDGGDSVCSPVHPHIRTAIRQVIQHANSRLHATVKRVNLRLLKYSFQIWQSKMSNSGTVSFCLLMGNKKKPVNPVLELFMWLIGRRRHTLPAIMLGIAEKVKNSKRDDEKLAQMCTRLHDELNEMLGDNGVFIYPTHPRPAPYHYQTLATFTNFAFTGIFNVLGLPVTQVPLGLSPDGVPVGVQVVGAKYQDHLTLAVAKELEEAFGGWIPPS